MLRIITKYCFIGFGSLNTSAQFLLLCAVNFYCLAIFGHTRSWKTAINTCKCHQIIWCWLIFSALSHLQINLIGCLFNLVFFRHLLLFFASRCTVEKNIQVIYIWKGNKKYLCAVLNAFENDSRYHSIIEYNFGAGHNQLH